MGNIIDISSSSRLLTTFRIYSSFKPDVLRCDAIFFHDCITYFNRQNAWWWWNFGKFKELRRNYHEKAGHPGNLSKLARRIQGKHGNNLLVVFLKHLDTCSPLRLISPVNGRTLMDISYESMDLNTKIWFSQILEGKQYNQRNWDSQNWIDYMWVNLQQQTNKSSQ